MNTKQASTKAGISTPDWSRIELAAKECMGESLTSTLACVMLRQLAPIDTSKPGAQTKK